MASVSAVSALLVAAADLSLVRAIRAADAASRPPGAYHNPTEAAPSSRPFHESTVHPGHGYIDRYESRFAVRDQAVLTLNPAVRVVQEVAPLDRPAAPPDPGARPGGTKVEAPWSKGPWAVREYPSAPATDASAAKRTVKLIVRTVDSLNRGAIIDVFC